MYYLWVATKLIDFHTACDKVVVQKRLVIRLFIARLL